MAYEVPTAAALIARYPAFAAVPLETIEIHIADAAASGVDETWAEADYAPAIAALAAHNMQLLGIGDHGEIAEYARQGLTGIRSGGFGANFSDRKVADASGGGLDATLYGKAYKVLLRRNKGGPRLVGTGVAPGDWGHIGQQNNGEYTPWAS